MAKRTDRRVSPETKRKISDGLKRYYKSVSAQRKQERSAKQSVAMIRYWSGIPKVNNNNDIVTNS